MSPSYQEIHQQASGKASYHLLPAHLLSILTGPEVVVLLGIADYYRHDTKLCSVGVRELEKTHTFGNRKTIGRCIARLAELGFVEVVEHGSYLGNVSKYRLPWKADGQLPAKAKALLSSQPAPAPPPIVSVPPAPAQAPSVASGKVVPAHEPSPYEVVLGMVTKEMERTAAAFAAGKPERTVNISGIRSAAKKFLEDSLQKTVQPLVDETVQTDKIELKKKYSVAEYAQLVQYWRTLILTDWAGEEGFALLSAHIVGTVKGLGPTAHAGIFVTSMSVGVLLN